MIPNVFQLETGLLGMPADHLGKGGTRLSGGIASYRDSRGWYGSPTIC